MSPQSHILLSVGHHYTLLTSPAEASRKGSAMTTGVREVETGKSDCKVVVLIITRIIKRTVKHRLKAELFCRAYDVSLDISDD